MNTTTWVGIGLYEGMMPDSIAKVELASMIPDLQRTEAYLQEVILHDDAECLRLECAGRLDKAARIADRVKIATRRLEDVRTVLRIARGF
jgi:hypothetical protein